MSVVAATLSDGGRSLRPRKGRPLGSTAVDRLDARGTAALLDGRSTRGDTADLDLSDPRARAIDYVYLRRLAAET